MAAFEYPKMLMRRAFVRWQRVATAAAEKRARYFRALEGLPQTGLEGLSTFDFGCFYYCYFFVQEKDFL